MKNTVAVAGSAVLALGIVAVPVGATMLDRGEQSESAAATGAESATKTAEATSADMSTVSLAATGAAFLALGVGSAAVAHRRRWQPAQATSVDLRTSRMERTSAPQPPA